MAMSSTGKSDITFVRASGTEDEGISRRLLYPKIRVVVIPTAAKMPPPKTTLAALFMLVTGTSFLLSGVYVYFANILTGSDRGLGLIVLGLLSKSDFIYTLFVAKPGYRVFGLLAHVLSHFPCDWSLFLQSYCDC